MQVDPSPSVAAELWPQMSSTASVDPTFPSGAAAASSIYHPRPQLAHQFSNKRSRPVSPLYEAEEFDLNQPSPKRPHVPTTPNSERSFVQSASSLRLSSPQSYPDEISIGPIGGYDSRGRQQYNTSFAPAIGSSLANGSDSFMSMDSLSAGGSGAGEGNKMDVSSSLESHNWNAHRGGSLPPSLYMSGTPASTPHHSPRLSSRVALPGSSSSFGSHSSAAYKQAIDSALVDPRSNPLAHLPYPTSSLTFDQPPTVERRPLQPPPPRSPNMFSMGPKPDCQKCEAGMPGHYSHWAR
ncbi:hypothetical protein [Phaffia rhodozyma]|uniref:Uncharacterized protein n=1 Tax=Phaffia rhodozyma TaxID=264483 RepID=A0A0F7SF26_PHARH|nr:hypothetical protein [Phaffia rhodozyma]